MTLAASEVVKTSLLESSYIGIARSHPLVQVLITVQNLSRVIWCSLWKMTFRVVLPFKARVYHAAGLFGRLCGGYCPSKVLTYHCSLSVSHWAYTIRLSKRCYISRKTNITRVRLSLYTWRSDQYLSFLLGTRSLIRELCRYLPG